MTVWLIGGGVMQMPLAQEIKRRGYKLLVTDFDPACPGQKIADKFLLLDVYSKTDVMNFVRYGSVRDIEAVLTAGTDAGPIVAKVAEALKLPGTSYKVSERCHRKTKMRSCLDQIPFMAGEINELAEWDHFPCVVKPDTCSGSRGISRVDHEADLQAALVKAMRANRDGTKVLIERLQQGQSWYEFMSPLMLYERLEASEVSMDFLVEAGQIHLANAALRLFWSDKFGIEAGHINPFHPSPELLAIAQDAADKLGIKAGPFKVDVKMTPTGWRILETANRLSGGFDHAFTCPLATGRDVTGAMLDFALGLGISHDKLTIKKSDTAVCYAPRYAPGAIKGWQIPDTWKSSVYVKHVTEIPPLAHNGDRPLFIIASGANSADAWEKAHEIARQIEPIRKTWWET
jgi:biotin carboxylase